MLEVAGTVILRSGAEPPDWNLSNVAYDNCGHTYYQAETSDGNLAIAATSVEALYQFATSLRDAVALYDVTESPEGKRTDG